MLCDLAALPDQRHARVRGQVELGGLLDFEVRHGRWGEMRGRRIIKSLRSVWVFSGLHEHAFRMEFYRIYIPLSIHLNKGRKILRY